MLVNCPLKPVSVTELTTLPSKNWLTFVPATLKWLPNCIPAPDVVRNLQPNRWSFLR